MEVIEKPPKMKLRTAVEIYFYQNPHAMIACLRTKEGREFCFRRNPITGEPVKISKAEGL